MCTLLVEVLLSFYRNVIINHYIDSNDLPNVPSVKIIDNSHGEINLVIHSRSLSRQNFTTRILIRRSQNIKFILEIEINNGESLHNK